MFQVCRALTLVARGDLELERVLDGSASQKRVVKYADTTWEVVIPDGESYGFNVQTWGETTRKFLKPIMALTDENFGMIVESAQVYTKGKDKSNESSDDKDELEELYGWR